VLAEPVAYSLWVDYYEDRSTVEEAWRETTRLDGDWERRLERVLIASGPVPYSLKAPVYQRLIDQRRWHPFIFRSLLHSAYDVYGHLDIAAARQLLGHLKLPPDTEHLDDLSAKLASTTPKERRVRDRARGVRRRHPRR
jgi:hypothetical protein